MLNEPKNYKYCYVIIVIIAAAWLSLNLFSGGSSVHDNGVTADCVRNDIRTTIDEQHKLGEAVEEIKVRVDNIAGTINGSETAVRNAAMSADCIENEIRRQRDIIAEAQSIIRGVRKGREE